MTRTRKAALALGVLAGALGVISIFGVAVARSDWFREKVRERIVSEAAKATNGRVELGGFQFDWKTLTAELDNMVIHGTEPAGQAPLFAVKRLVIGLKIVSLAQRTFNIASVSAEQPQAHLIVQPDGNTNIPPPQRFKPQMLIDLKVGRFDLKDGLFLVEAPDKKPNTMHWSARGENLATQATFNPVKASYSGEVSLDPLHLVWNGFGAVDARVKASATMERNRLTVSRATLQTTAKNPSELNLSNVVMEGFTNPVVTASYDASLALEEADRVFHLTDFAHTGSIGVKGNARFVSMQDYLVSGDFRGSDLGYGKVKNLRTAGSFQANPQSVNLKDVRVGVLDGEIEASGEVKNLSTFRVAGQLRHFEVAPLVTLAGANALPYDGSLSGPFALSGTLSERNFHDLTATAKLTVAPAASGIPVTWRADRKARRHRRDRRSHTVMARASPTPGWTFRAFPVRP